MDEELHNNIDDSKIIETICTPLGLCALGLTVILLNLHNIGFKELDSKTLGIGIFIGGFLQIIAGLIELKKNNKFATTAFTFYGVFWLTLISLIVFPKMGLINGPSNFLMGSYLLVWAFFTTTLFIVTFKINKALQFVFGSLALFFFLLATSSFTGNSLFTLIAAFEGIICGLVAIYTAFAQVLNKFFYDEIFPLGIVRN